MADTIATMTAALAGRYRLEREIGQGGMATVYLARDLRHDRPVALKFLRRELGAVLGVERFLSEIRVTANLQHPNLLPLFDSGEADGLLFYVMPFVDGESLRAKLDREKQLPVDETMRIAVALAAALDHAHRHGVIHRDLKPENILMRDGQPVIADFGIALAVSNAGGNRITQTGLSLGTPQYMSPEQATGDRVIDARTDIYSLGAVTYEMLTGEPPHTGSTAQAVIARLLTDKPRSVRTLRPKIPAHVDGALEQALEKLPADRWATARDFADALQGLRATRGASANTARPRSAMRERVVLAVAIAGVAALALLFVQLRSIPAAAPLKSRIPMSESVGNQIAISHDGRTIVYADNIDGTRRLYAQSLDQIAPRAIDGSDGGSRPAFSGDGRWVAFTTSDGKLKKAPIEGGVAVTITSVIAPQGVTWVPGGPIVFGMPLYDSIFSGLSRVPTNADAKVEEATRPPDHSVMHHLPVALADGKTVLMSNINQGNPRPDARYKGTVIGVMTLSSAKYSELDLPATAPVGVVDGTLLYIASGGVLMAAPFDVKRSQVTGPSVKVSDDFVRLRSAALADNGTLAVLRYPLENELVMVDMQGVVQPLLAEPGRGFGQPRVSPDGRRVLSFSIAQGQGMLAAYDLALRTPTPIAGSHATYEWTPDGKRVYFTMAGASHEVLVQRADGSDSSRVMFTAAGESVHEFVMSPDQRSLLIVVGRGLGKFDIMMAAIHGDTTLRPFQVTDANELLPTFSADGHWVAFVSDASGRNEVYVSAFPGPGGRVLVSENGGNEPVWSHAGRTLYYRSGRRMIAATMDAAGGAVTQRTTLFEGDFQGNCDIRCYDVAPDDKHFVMGRLKIKPDIVIWTNWLDELRAKMKAPH